MRWSKQWGSIYLGEQKVPILYLRGRDRNKGREIGLSSYRLLQEPGTVKFLLGEILLSLSCTDYEGCSEMNREVFGLDAITVSRRFIGTN